MAINNTPEQKETLFNDIILDISENKMPLRKALKNRLSVGSFYDIIKEDEGKNERYARACEARAEIIFDEMLDISDDGTNDFTKKEIGDGVEVEILNSEHIQRSKLRIDTRKWILAKMQPKKYGDRINTELSGEVTITSLTPEQRDKRISELMAKINK